MPQLQAVNLLEQCLRRRRTTQEILHQGSGVTLRAVSQQLFGEPAIPAGISRIESTQGFGDVLPHLGSKDGPQAVGISNAPRKRTKSAMTLPSGPAEPPTSQSGPRTEEFRNRPTPSRSVWQDGASSTIEKTWWRTQSPSPSDQSHCCQSIMPLCLRAVEARHERQSEPVARSRNGNCVGHRHWALLWNESVRPKTKSERSGASQACIGAKGSAYERGGAMELRARCSRPCRKTGSTTGDRSLDHSGSAE